MALLNTIRSWTWGLIIFIGFALFAFVAGDAWKAISPHTQQSAGVIDGHKLSAQEYQKLVEEYTDVVKFSTGNNSLTEAQNNQIKDEVWRNYVNNILIGKACDELGIVVSNEEIKYVVDNGTSPLLQQTPFVNQETRRFDPDMLKKFLLDYDTMSKSGQLMGQNAEYYQKLYNYWRFIEKNIRSSSLASKYNDLIANSLAVSGVEAQNALMAETNQSDLLLAAIPYSSVADSLVKVTDNDVENLYNSRKEQYRQFAETRDISYINVTVKASDADRKLIQKDVSESIEELRAPDAEYSAIVRSAGSEVNYKDLYMASSVLPRDVVSRLDSVKVGDVYGPYSNAQDNTINAFKLVAKEVAPDSVAFRTIFVQGADAASSKHVADSLLTVLNGKDADFVAVAMSLNQKGATNWWSSQNYATGDISPDNLSLIQAVYSMKKGETKAISMMNNQVILQVVDQKENKDRYKVAIVKRIVTFSNETYTNYYNNFSQFLADNPSLEDIKANAEDAGYRLMTRANISSASHDVVGISGTRDVLKWAFAADKDDVSTLFECGENDQMLVVVLTGINEKGYRPLNSVATELRAQLLRDKKFDYIKANLDGKNTIAEVASQPEAVTDSIKRVTFAAPAYVSVLRSSEPMVSAYASVAKEGVVSNPVKGNAGVLVMQVYKKDQIESDQTLESITNRLKGLNARIGSQYVNDLYLKSDVEDNRYLFF